MKRRNMQTILLILVLCLGLGYAYINSDLNINGTAQVNSANWDIHWANIAVTNGSVSGSNVVTAPAISNNTTVNYSVILPQPGDYYEFTVDAVNGGSLDAMIDNIDSKLNGATITTLPAYLKYSVTYADGVALAPNHKLVHNTTEKYKVRIEYNPDVNTNQLPVSNQTLNLQFTVTYRQANENVVNRPTVIYTSNIYDNEDYENTSAFLGQTISPSITQYNNPQGAIDAFNQHASRTDLNFYLKHVIQDGVILESYVGFIVTPEIVQDNPGMRAGTYEVRGLDTYDENYNCKSEYYISGDCISPYDAENKRILATAFGNKRCDFSSVDNYDCHSSSFSVGASRGGVGAYIGGWNCNVAITGESNCGYRY